MSASDQKRTVTTRILRSDVRTRIAQDQLKALRCSDTKGHARAALGHKAGARIRLLRSQFKSVPAHQFIAQRTLGRRVSRLVLVRLALVLAPFLRFARHRFRFRLPMLRFKSESRFALRSRNILLTRAMISSSVYSISGRSSGRSRSSCRTFPSMFAMKASRAVKRAFVTLIRSSS